MALKARAHESDLRSGGADQRQAALHATGIDLSPLIEAYKGYGKLTLRLENLPAKARFSAGMRAGERSWSLTPDDLPGLNYLLPEDTSADHTVKVRIIGMERGDTLAVMDVKVAQYLGNSRKAPTGARSDTDAAQPGEQLAKAQSAVGALQIELSDALAEIKRLSSSRDGGAKAESAAARAKWQEEEEKRLAAAEREWSARAQEQTDSLQTQLSATLKQVQRLQSSQPEAIANEVASAKSGWKAAESQRFAKAEADWARQSEEKISELQSQLSEARKKHLKLQSEKSADWAAELEAAHVEWKAEEGKRVARAEAAWAADLDKATDSLKAELAEARKQAAQSASGRPKDSRNDLDALRRELQAESATRLATAEAEWKSTETARLKELESGWKAKLQQLEERLSSESSQKGAAEPGVDSKALREAIATLQTTVVEREADLERATKQIELERSSRQKFAQELRAAQDAANRNELELREQHADSLEQTEARWKQSSASEVKTAMARAESAESKLVGLRAIAADSARLDKEVSSLRLALAAREAELQRFQHNPGWAEDERLAKANADAAAATLSASKKLLAAPFLREIIVGVVCTVATILVVPAFQSQPVVVMQASASAPGAQVVEQKLVQPLLSTVVVLRNTRLRAAPGKDERAILRVEKGIEVGVLKTEGGWTLVKMNYKTSLAEGWIENESLDLASLARARPVQ